MSAFETAPSSNDILWNESEEELETAGIEVRQYSVAEAEYEAAGAEDEESSAEEAVETLGNVPTKKQSTVLEGEEKYPSFSLADDNEAGPVTAFNLDEELDQGYVDKEGNFVDYYFENRLENLEGVVSSSDEEEETTMKKRKPVRRPRRERDEWADAIEVVKPTYAVQNSEANDEVIPVEEAEASDKYSPERTKEMYAKLARLVHPRENILQALKRLAGNRKDSVAKREFNEVTELADSLLNRGEYNIYEETRESCLEKGGLGEFGCSSLSKSKGKRKREDGTSEELDLSQEERLKFHWELKWAHDPSQVYGPFSSEQLRNWQSWGYFNEAEAFVRDTETSESFCSASSIDFSQYRD